ncbi:MAG: PQQ-binding-like beta-propeller repeat protein [Planctomycetaceae bacterium]|nr:PQQ-binding-like beta-propeller repeat protein [Planctomycetaceae bacterium]
MMMPQRIFLCVFFSIGSVSPSFSEDWPHWRGMARNDVIAENSGWNGGKWPPNGEAWRINVGIGCSSPVIVEGNVYITGWRNNRDTVFCLEAATGHELWTVGYACPKYGRHSTGDKGIYAGPTSTPAFDPETKRLYTLSTDGDLNCWNTQAKGKRVWGFNLYDRFQVKQRPDVGRRSLRDYGYTSSPLLYKNWAIVEVGDDEGTVVAFDKSDGKKVWTSECKDEAGHTASPVLMTVEGVPCLAVLTLRNLVVMRLDKDHEGETVAEYPWATDFANNIPTPAVVGDSVLITSAYNHYAMCRVKFTLKGAEKLWENENPSGVCSPVVYKDRVYWAWRGIHCVDLNTGQEIWRGGKVGTAGSCLITQDERLMIWADNGELILSETAERSPKKFTELAHGRSLFRSDAWPHLVLANGRIFVKDREGNLACFALKATVR